METLNLDRNEAIKVADEIRKKYKEVMSYYQELEPKSQVPTEEEPQEMAEKPRETPFKAPEGVEMIEAKSGNVFVAIPKDHRSLEIAKKLLDILSLQIEEQRK